MSYYNVIYCVEFEGGLRPNTLLIDMYEDCKGWHAQLQNNKVARHKKYIHRHARTCGSICTTRHMACCICFSHAPHLTWHVAFASLIHMACCMLLSLIAIGCGAVGTLRPPHQYKLTLLCVCVFLLSLSLSAVRQQVSGKTLCLSRTF